MSLTFEEFDRLDPKQKAQFYALVSKENKYQKNMNIPLSITNKKKIKIKNSFPYSSI